jgi:hypothetical protein
VPEGANSFVTDPMAAFAAAEAKLTEAFLGPGPCARPYVRLGLVDVWTKRTAQGIVKCELTLAPDRNLAHAHSIIGRGMVFMWTTRSDDPTYLAQLEPILEGMRKAGVPEQ